VPCLAATQSRLGPDAAQLASRLFESFSAEEDEAFARRLQATSDAATRLEQRLSVMRDEDAALRLHAELNAADSIGCSTGPEGVRRRSWRRYVTSQGVPYFHHSPTGTSQWADPDGKSWADVAEPNGPPFELIDAIDAPHLRRDPPQGFERADCADAKAHICTETRPHLRDASPSADAAASCAAESPRWQPTAQEAAAFVRRVIAGMDQDDRGVAVRDGVSVRDAPLDDEFVRLRSAAHDVEDVALLLAPRSASAWVTDDSVTTPPAERASETPSSCSGDGVGARAATAAAAVMITKAEEVTAWLGRVETRYSIVTVLGPHRVTCVKSYEDFQRLHGVVRTVQCGEQQTHRTVAHHQCGSASVRDG
jgi:hypothetical protein